ncbi:unnamed protein product [Lactuca saligna]|uniref:Uncharacterized protein n=1 Tax=Lactuca saligna TaxID=75948 RepID=A0AA35YYU1_LACSI|nr:unnamed protein product [Lactuca saligna]
MEQSALTAQGKSSQVSFLGNNPLEASFPPFSWNPEGQNCQKGKIFLLIVGHVIRASHIGPDCPEPTLDDVMWDLAASQEERHWMMASLVTVRRYLGMDHLQFPSADPIIPPPYQQHKTDHDGVDTSGTCLGDTNDDDDNNDDEETETESESSEEYICGFILYIDDVF